MSSSPNLNQKKNFTSRNTGARWKMCRWEQDGTGKSRRCCFCIRILNFFLNYFSFCFIYHIRWLSSSFLCDLCVSKTWSQGWAGEGAGTRREVKMSWRRSWRWAATATSRVRIRRIYGNIPNLPPKHHHIFASHQQCWKGDMNLVCDKEKSKCVCRHRTEWVSRWKTLIFIIHRLFF